MTAVKEPVKKLHVQKRSIMKRHKLKMAHHKRPKLKITHAHNDPRHKTSKDPNDPRPKTTPDTKMAQGTEQPKLAKNFNIYYQHIFCGKTICDGLFFIFIN